MMMEDTDDNGSSDGMMVEENLNDESEAPSSALRPKNSDDGGDDTVASQAASAPSPATDASDQFKFLSISSAPPAAAATSSVFGASNSNVGLENGPATKDLVSVNASAPATADNTEMNIKASESAASGSLNPRALQTAESGNLLHLKDTGDKAEGPSDLMDYNFQTLPVATAPSSTVDPFENPGPSSESIQGSINTNKPTDVTKTNKAERSNVQAEGRSAANENDTENGASRREDKDQQASDHKVDPEKKGNPSSSKGLEPSTPGKALQTIGDESSTFEEVELASAATDQGSNCQDKGKTVTTATNNDARAHLKPLLTDSQAKPENSTTDPVPREEQTKKIEELETKLSLAGKEIASLKKEKEDGDNKHNEKLAEITAILQELQTKLQNEQTQRAEAENHAKLAQEEIKKLKSSMLMQQEQWQAAIEESRTHLHAVEKENEELISRAKEEKHERQEHERRERVLANKLNNLKKAQVTKTDVEDVYEDDLRLLKQEVATKTKRMEELEAANAQLKEEMELQNVTAKTRIDTLEKAVREEKNLNEERKKKMKSFVEAKTEELKEAQSQAEHYQNELNQNSQGMVDLNNRWKTLHAQWVQSQTRNRELQRDLNKIKKDYDNLNKVGDSVSAKLSRSSNEVEQHKNKRLAAKQELMTVLGKLDAEREISNKLRDSVRFTFTPKAQSQHQLLKENLEEFQKQLQALARRLGRPIPLSNNQDSQLLASMVMSSIEESEVSERDDDLSPSDGARDDNGGQDGGDSGASKEQRKVLMEITRLLAKLEVETQRISQGIMAFSSGIEQMNQLIVGGGERTCFTSLGDIVFGGGVAKALESGQGGARNNAPTSGRGAVKSGHVSHFPTESSGQLT